jgi:hypothetical protein
LHYPEDQVEHCIRLFDPIVLCGRQLWKMLQRLDRSVFDITYIHFCPSVNCRTDAFVNVHEQDKLIILQRNANNIMNAVLLQFGGIESQHFVVLILP